MANDLNQCSFIGRLGKDPDLRYLPSGGAVASFSIAVGWKSKDKEGVEWANIVAFGKLAEICGEYLRKGSQVFIQGRFKNEKYEKNGETKYATKFVADKMQMLGGRPDGGGGSDKAKNQGESYPESGFEFDDDVPF